MLISSESDEIGMSRGKKRKLRSNLSSSSRKRTSKNPLMPSPKSSLESPLAAPISEGEQADKDDDDISVISTDLPPADTPSRKKNRVKEKRGRGRPPTTGYYVGRAQAMERAAVANESLALSHAELDVMDDTVPPPPLNISARQTQEKACESFRDLPFREILREVGRRWDQILKVSGGFNLKGTFQKYLQDAAATINAAMWTLGERNEDDESANLVRINANLRSEVANLRAEVEHLKQEIARRNWEPGPLRYISPPLSLPDAGLAASSPRQRTESSVLPPHNQGGEERRETKDRLVGGQQDGSRSHDRLPRKYVDLAYRATGGGQVGGFREKLRS